MPARRAQPTAYDFGPMAGLERRSGPQADELDGADPRPAAAAGGRRGGDRADRQRLASVRRRRLERGLECRRPTASGCKPDERAGTGEDGYYVVQAGDRLHDDRRARPASRGDAERAQPEPRPVQALQVRELRRPGRRRVQGARRGLSAVAARPPAGARPRAALRGRRRRGAAEPPARAAGAGLDPGRRRRRRGARRPPAPAARLDRLDDEADDRLRRSKRAAASTRPWSRPPYDALAGRVAARAEAGERIEVRDLLYGLLLVTGNDAAEALAQAAAGSEDAFVAEMNRRRAPSSGSTTPATRTRSASTSPATTRAPRTWPTLTIELRRGHALSPHRRHPDDDDLERRAPAQTRQPQHRSCARSRTSTGSRPATRSTPATCSSAPASRKGVELVSAVLGAPSESERDAATLALLDYGFSLYHRRTPVGTQAEASVAVRDRDRTAVRAGRGERRPGHRPRRPGGRHAGQGADRGRRPDQPRPAPRGQIVVTSTARPGPGAAGREPARPRPRPARALRRRAPGTATGRLGARDRRSGAA